MIWLNLNEEKYEYDIRGLLTSFYPGAEITKTDTISYEVGDRILSVCYSETKIRVTLRNADGIVTENETTVSAADRKAEKSALKRLVYRMLSGDTGKELPWGTLTGIRPTKIAMTLLEEGASDEEIGAHYQKEYLTGAQKTSLAIEIAKREKDVLKNIDYQDGYSIYIGIPFCPTTCLYCSFTSYPVKKWLPRMQEYIDAVSKEIEYTAKRFAGKKLNTLYIGGGTPTTLEPEYLEQLLQKIEDTLDLSDLQEWTVEAGRPDSVTREKLKVMRRHPVSRISINPQTMKAETLKIIGRRHTPEQIEEAFAMAREEGFDNINMDLIMGLPEENIDDVRRTMEKMTQMDPDNITVHSLAIKRAARLNQEWERYAHMKFENTQEMMDLTQEYCRTLGLAPYYLYRQKNMAGNFENVGYAKPGKAGIYNILIMEEKQTIVAMGAGSTTKAVYRDGTIERCNNVKDVDLYLGQIDEMIRRKDELFSDL